MPSRGQATMRTSVPEGELVPGCQQPQPLTEEAGASQQHGDYLSGPTIGCWFPCACWLIFTLLVPSEQQEFQVSSDSLFEQTGQFWVFSIPSSHREEYV